ncbi:hypothetical protein VSDG_01825 [Cytospora chrysosperma]|uniref:4Fe-4S ferredoxin-type domain-containing protein n=1 Tax=Cytospora chrysosperma TaxID=252740 RepID=A0A423WHH5_CYTCH|nr:hypothetical protein VSDG_01825 [Valsa sordida]
MDTMSTNARSLATILAVAILSPLATADDEICTLEVRTATVTECFPNTGTPVTPSCRASCPTPMASAHPNGPIFVEVEAPKCDSCGCDTCVHTNVYTTTYDVFCPTGISQQEYVVTETYSGMSGRPTMPSSTHLPFGFTAGVKTCNECGDEPMTATITYPATGCPYILGMSEPTGAPEGVPAYEVCTTGTGANGAEETAPIEGPSKGAPGSESSPGYGSGSGSGSSSGSSPGSGAAPGSSAGAGPGDNGGYETSPESEAGSSPALGSGKVSSGSGAGSGSSSVGSSGSGSNSGSSPVGYSGSGEGSGSSPGSESMPGKSAGSSASPAGTGTNDYSETSAGHPTFMAVTMGGVLGFFISFLALAL